MDKDKEIKLSTAANADQPEQPGRRRLFGGIAAAAVATALPSIAEAATHKSGQEAKRHYSGNFEQRLKAKAKNVVVIYMENRSFNNLFGDFPGVQAPLSKVTAEAARQMDRNGQPLAQLPAIWGGLVPQQQVLGGTAYQIPEKAINGLPNGPFAISDDKGKPLPETVITRDLIHAFYQNQMQINGGKNDGFAAWGDSGALVMGYYSETAKNLNMWKLAQEYTLCDNFFMAAFGGSFLNHQFLACGRSPFYPDVASSVAKDKVAVLEDGPKGIRLAMNDKSPASAMDGVPKFINAGQLTPDGYAVNTMQPPYQPSAFKAPAGTDERLSDVSNPKVLVPQTHKTIGDLLSEKHVSWAWYAGGMQAAMEGQGGPNVPNFQYHHNPLNYFKQFAPGTKAREEHLRDAGLGDGPISNRFIADAIAGKLPAVTFYKPQGNLNMHAGYSDVSSGDQHVANIIAHLQKSPQWEDMVVVITFDENGGWWDHVTPPKGDRWGPGSRIPALVISPHAKKGHVAHEFYDTTSILRLITRVHDLPLLEGLAERNAACKANGVAAPGDLVDTLTV